MLLKEMSWAGSLHRIQEASLYTKRFLPTAEEQESIDWCYSNLSEEDVLECEEEAGESVRTGGPQGRRRRHASYAAGGPNNPNCPSPGRIFENCNE
jgi:hypothetical protein